jgi:hypothetical protein
LHNRLRSLRTLDARSVAVDFDKLRHQVGKVTKDAVSNMRAHPAVGHAASPTCTT